MDINALPKYDASEKSRDDVSTYEMATELYALAAAWFHSVGSVLRFQWIAEGKLEVTGEQRTP